MQVRHPQGPGGPEGRDKLASLERARRRSWGPCQDGGMLTPQNQKRVVVAVALLAGLAMVLALIAPVLFA
jgi:hypothetical protein